MIVRIRGAEVKTFAFLCLLAYCSVFNHVIYPLVVGVKSSPLIL